MDIQAFLNLHYMETISLDDLSKSFYISVYYLERRFKSLTGYSVNQYIIHRRMGEAERLLIYSSLSIKEISVKCGFVSVPYFYSTFKKYTRCTPSEFREKYDKSLPCL
jgi:AraC-like DNA-binding protein